MSHYAASVQVPTFTHPSDIYLLTAFRFSQVPSLSYVTYLGKASRHRSIWLERYCNLTGSFTLPFIPLSLVLKTEYEGDQGTRSFTFRLAATYQALKHLNIFPKATGNRSSTIGARRGIPNFNQAIEAKSPTHQSCNMYAVWADQSQKHGIR